MNGAVITVDRDDDAQRDGNLGGGQSHDEQHKNLPDSRVGGKKTVYGHEIQGSGGKDQFARNEHADERAAPDQAVNADRQQQGCDDEIGPGLGREMQGVHVLVLPERAITSAPRMATRSTSEISSKAML